MHVTTLLRGAVLKMQKTLFDFCARSTGERDEIPSSAESSLDLESSDVTQDTDSVISRYYPQSSRASSAYECHS